MKVDVYKKTGEKESGIIVADDFAAEVSGKTAATYINYVRAVLRAPIANTKNRGEVSGGGRKPYRQKGTGRARAGSSRSPIWVGGGVTFGPTNDRNFSLRLNEKIRRKVVRAILTDMIKSKVLIAVSDLNFDAPKTEKAIELLDNLKAEGKICVIVSKEDQNAVLSFRNISGVEVMPSTNLNIIALLSPNKVAVSKKALEEVIKMYSIQKKAQMKEVVEKKSDE